MRILDTNLNEIKESDIDLTAGKTYQMAVIKPDAIPIDNITKFAWDDDDYEMALIYEVIPEITRVTNRINNLKSSLSDTDYIVVKIAEGVATQESYKEVLEQRKMWRKEINELEVVLTNITSNE